MGTGESNPKSKLCILIEDVDADAGADILILQTNTTIQSNTRILETISSRNRINCVCCIVGSYETHWVRP